LRSGSRQPIQRREDTLRRRSLRPRRQLTHSARRPNPTPTPSQHRTYFEWRADSGRTAAASSTAMTSTTTLSQQQPPEAWHGQTESPRPSDRMARGVGANLRDFVLRNRLLSEDGENDAPHGLLARSSSSCPPPRVDFLRLKKPSPRASAPRSGENRELSARELRSGRTLTSMSV
jgi:hypothetical protein